MRYCALLEKYLATSVITLPNDWQAFCVLNKRKISQMKMPN